MKKKTSILLLVAALFAAIAVPTWAVGVMPEKMMDIYMDSIYKNDSAKVADFSKAADMRVASEDAQIALPAAGENAIKVAREMENGLFDMQIGLPSANEDIALLSDRAIYKEDGYTQAVQVADSDIHIVTSVLNDEAQSEFAYDFALPAGAYMEYADYGTDNSVLIYNEDDQIVYTLVPGIAKDANGKELDFVWNLQGNTLVYGIEDGQELAYPLNVSVNVLAAYDIDYYFSARSWKTLHPNYPNEQQLSLKPRYERLFAIGTPSGFASHKAASWAAVYDTYHNSANWIYDSGMQSQYMCHYNNCPPQSNTESRCYTWDLENWCDGKATLLGNQCNPCEPSSGSNNIITNVCQ